MLRNSKLYAVPSAIVLLVAAALACAAPPPPLPIPTAVPVTALPTADVRANLPARWLMDWDAASRKVWYETPQGSFIMPMDIFMALKTASGARLFSSRENLERYGWIYPPDSDAAALTVNGLPLGFAQEPNPYMNNKPTFGLTCAACHSGQLVFNNTRYVIDGAAPLIDIQDWDLDMAAALVATLNNDGRYQELQQAIAARNPNSPYVFSPTQLKNDLTTVYEYLDGRAQRNIPTLDYGWGRLDAFTIIANEVQIHSAQLTQKDAQGKYINAEAPASPVSIPYLWNVPQLECVQTNCLGTEPMTRNLGETLGVYGEIRLRVLPDAPKLDFNNALALTTAGQQFDFSANPNNLYTLEHELASLPPPKWQDVFGPLNTDLVKRGAEIYGNPVYNVNGKMESCATCHVNADMNDPASLTPVNSLGHQLLKVTRWSPQVTGTDTAFLDQQTLRPVTGLPPLLDGIYDTIIYSNQPLLERFTNPDKKYSLDFLGLAVNLGMKKWFAVNKIPDSEQARFREYHELTFQEDLDKYKARPLDGIAFTSPYLHNGSVPSLQELLKKPAERAKTFALGSLSWDPQAVGYKTSDSEYFDYSKFIFDTSLPGNHNTGHEWGTELSDADKAALIEYLKSQ